MARFEFLLTLPETPLVTLLIITFKRSKERSDECEKI